MSIDERPAPGISAQQGYQLTRWERRFIGGHLLIAIIALGIGSLLGPLQALEFSNVDLYPYLEPVLKSYYQGLSLHGVLNALVWTTFFIVGFTTFTTIKGLGRPLSHPRINQAGFITMIVGLLLTAVPLLLDQATVLYTFYPPLKASWAFYVGLGASQFASLPSWSEIQTVKLPRSRRPASYSCQFRTR